MSSQGTIKKDPRNQNEKKSQNEKSVIKPAISEAQRREKIVRRLGIIGGIVLATSLVGLFIIMQPTSVDINGHSRWWSLLVVPLAMGTLFLFYPEKKYQKQIVWRFIVPIGVGVGAIFLLENWKMLDDLATMFKSLGFQASTRRGSPSIRELPLQLLYNKAILVGLLAIFGAAGFSVLTKFTHWQVPSKTPLIGLFLATIFLGLFLIRGLEIVASILLGYVTALGLAIGITLLAVMAWGIYALIRSLFKKFWLWISGQS